MMSPEFTNLFECACCQRRTLPTGEEGDICPNCNWQKDSLQEEYPDLQGGANPGSLSECKEQRSKQRAK